MKKSKRLISIILIIFIGILSLTVECFADVDYDIDIPSSYTEAGDDYYKDDKGHSISIDTEEGDFDDEEDIYTSEKLDEIILMFYQEISYYADVKIVEKDISRFTLNEYRCFEFVLEIKMDNFNAIYEKFYIAANEDELILLLIQSNEYEYFDSEELNDIIDSFTVEDLVGRKQEKEKIWKNTFLIGCALVGLIFVYGIFNKIREKNFYNKSQVILQQQELAQKRAERELQKSLEIEKTSSNNRNRNNEGFSTVNPNLTNGSFDIRDNNKVKDDAPSFTTTKTNDLNFEKRKCPNCGKENEEYWAFCNYCGHKLDKND